MFTCDPYAVWISAPKDLLHAVPEVVEVVHGHRDHLVLNRPRKSKEAVQDFVTEHGQDPSEVEVRPGYAEVIVLFFEGDVVGVSAQDVLEQALKLVNIIIFLSSELEFDNLLGLLSVHSSLLLILLLAVEIFSQIVEDSIIMVPVFF